MRGIQQPASDSASNNPVERTASYVDIARSRNGMSGNHSVDPCRPRYIPPDTYRSCRIHPSFGATLPSYELAGAAAPGRRPQQASNTSPHSVRSSPVERTLNSVSINTYDSTSINYPRSDLSQPESGSWTKSTISKACDSTPAEAERVKNSNTETTHHPLSDTRSPALNVPDLQAVADWPDCDSSHRQLMPSSSISASTIEMSAKKLDHVEDDLAKLAITQPMPAGNNDELEPEYHSDASWDKVHASDAACIECSSDESVVDDSEVTFVVCSQQHLPCSERRISGVSYSGSEGEPHVQSRPSDVQAGDQGGDGPSGGRASSSKSCRGALPGGRPSKRTRPNDPGEDDEDDPDQPERTQSSPNTPQDSGRDMKCLACPFVKANRCQFTTANATCSGLTLRTIKAVKQHLDRRHKRPDYCCPRCSEIFETDDQCRQHLREETCQVSEDKYIDKMTKDQWDTISKKRRGTPDDVWYAIFETLFPDKRRPLTPYRDDPRSFAAERISTIVEFFGCEAFSAMCERRRQETGHQIDESTQIIIDEVSEALRSRLPHDEVDRYFDLTAYLNTEV